MRRHPKASAVGSTQRQASGLRHSGIASACLLALLAFCGIGASTAFAAETRVPEPFSPLTGSGSEVTITESGAVAVDEASGNVFLNDGETVTDILGAEGGTPAGLVSPFQLTGFCFVGRQNGIAFDNSAASPNKGTLYVVDCGGEVKKFTRNPLTEKYEPAGALTAPGFLNLGAAVDTQGNLFVTDAFGPGVAKFNPAGTQVAYFDLSSSAGSFVEGVAVDGTGDLFVSGSGGRLLEYPADGAGEIDPSVFTPILPSGSDARGLAVDFATDKLFVSFGDRAAQYDATTLAKEFEFGAGTLSGSYRVAVNSATDRVYVSDTDFESGTGSVAVFGSPVSIPDVTTKAASEVAGSTATLNGVVNPQAIEVTDCFFEYGLTVAYGETAHCEGAIPTGSKDHAVSASIGGLEPNGTTYHFRIVVDSANGEVKGTDRTLTTGDTVFTEPATAVVDTTATLNGIVRPEGEPLTDCEFEYGTALDYGQSVPCSPSAATIPDDFAPHPVTGALSGLEPNTTYHFRLLATNADGTAFGESRTFSTFGPPRIVEQRPINATQTAVTLQARIDPSGSPTTYHFEFGPDTAYGTRIPADHELFAGSGTDPVAVSALRNGLQEASVYWFRVVATNSTGTTIGSDQRLETLNEHGLPNNRAFEQVTPADKGAAGSVAVSVDSQPIRPSLGGESFAYPFLNGYEASTAGGSLRHLAGRSDEGWLSTQISGPSLVPSPSLEGTGIALPSEVLYISPDNSCAVLASYNPLSEDTPATSVELGLTNLYRWSAAEGEYELLTKQLPLNPEVVAFGTPYYTGVDASDDCRRVYFKSLYDFIPGPQSGLYESEEGTVRDAGGLPDGDVGSPMQVPGGGGAADAVLGGELTEGLTARWNAVSPDGSRVFFTAIANEGTSNGNPAIFMRTDGDDVVEISDSQTAVATDGARFEAASPDGDVVFFRANYGIADTGSAGPPDGACGPQQFETGSGLEEKPCDLYAYDVETEELTDLSPEADAPGAQIQGTIAVDDDGSHVYFAALGQLVPGQGRTYAENTAGFGSANVYLAHDEDPDDGQLSYELSYVTTLAEHGPTPSPGGNTGDLLGVSGSQGAALMRRGAGWGASTTPDGDKLLFLSSLNLTGWESGANYKYAAYLFSEDTGDIACVSCRPDGLPSVALPARVVEKVTTAPNVAAQSAELLARRGSKGGEVSLSEDGSRVAFTSPDVLAPGAVQGRRNVYQWQEGQVSFLAVAEAGGTGGLLGYMGMSSDGEDVFLATNERLVPQDRDSLSDVYDVRIDGGFPFTPEPPECQVDEAVPLVLNQIYCQGTPAPQPQAPGPASAGFAGPGNPPESKPRPRTCRKGQVRRHGKCVKRPKRGAERKKSRAAKTNRGGSK